MVTCSDDAQHPCTLAPFTLGSIKGVVSTTRFLLERYGISSTRRGADRFNVAVVVVVVVVVTVADVVVVVVVVVVAAVVLAVVVAVVVVDSMFSRSICGINSQKN